MLHRDGAATAVAVGISNTSRNASPRVLREAGKSSSAPRLPAERVAGPAQTSSSGRKSPGAREGPDAYSRGRSAGLAKRGLGCERTPDSLWSSTAPRAHPRPLPRFRAQHSCAETLDRPINTFP
jgi:hypothetical protein